MVELSEEEVLKHLNIDEMDEVRKIDEVYQFL